MRRKKKVEEENFSIHTGFRSSVVAFFLFFFSFLFLKTNKQKQKGPHDHEALVVGADNNGKNITDIKNQKNKDEDCQGKFERCTGYNK